MSRPSHSCPRYVCAQVRKILRREGFQFGKVTGRYSYFSGSQKITEGLHVKKIGCSRFVSVGITTRASAGSDALGALKAERDRAVLLLRRRGYAFVAGRDGTIECDNYDECDS